MDKKSSNADNKDGTLQNGINWILKFPKENSEVDKDNSKQNSVYQAFESSQTPDEFQYSKHFDGYTFKEKQQLIAKFQETAKRFDLKWTKPHDYTKVLSQHGFAKKPTDNSEIYKDKFIKPSEQYSETNDRFAEFYATKSRILGSEWCLSSFVTNHVLSQIEDKLQNILEQDKNKRENSKYQYLTVGKFEVSGSSADGLKAVKPNEFDVEIPVKIIGADGTPALMAIGKQDGSDDVPHGWFKMKLTEELDIHSKKNDRKVLVDKHDAQWLSTAGFKDTIMRSLIQKSINEIPLMTEVVKPGKDPWLIQPVLRKVSGPALTIDILLGKEVRNKLEQAEMKPMTRISVDLVPRLDLQKGKYDHEPLSNGSQVTKAVSTPNSSMNNPFETTTSNQKTTSAPNQKTTPTSNQKITSTSNQKTSSASNQKTCTTSTSTSSQKTTYTSNQKSTTDSHQTSTSASKQRQKPTSTSNQKSTSFSNQKTTSAPNQKRTSDSNQRAPSTSNQKSTSDSNQTSTSASNQKTTSDSNQKSTSDSNQKATSSSNQTTSASNQKTSSTSNRKSINDSDRNTGTENPHLGAVAKPCMSNTAQGLDVPTNAGLCQLFFRASFSKYENLLQRNIQQKLGKENCNRAVIQTMKTVQSNDVYRSPSSQLKSMTSSYHMKTAAQHLALHSIKTQPDVSSHWSPQNFTSRMGDMCAFIDKAVENKNLPHTMFCNPCVNQVNPVFDQLTTLNSPRNLNVFSRMSDTTASNIRSDLDKAFKHQLGVDYKDLCAMGKVGENAYQWATANYDAKK